MLQRWTSRIEALARLEAHRTNLDGNGKYFITPVSVAHTTNRAGNLPCHEGDVAKTIEQALYNGEVVINRYGRMISIWGVQESEAKCEALPLCIKNIIISKTFSTGIVTNGLLIDSLQQQNKKNKQTNQPTNKQTNKQTKNRKKKLPDFFSGSYVSCRYRIATIFLNHVTVTEIWRFKLKTNIDNPQARILTEKIISWTGSSVRRSS